MTDDDPHRGDTLLRRGPFLAVLLQGLPLAIGLASHAVINLVDLALVGRLGDDAVQAVHVATTWNFLPMIVGQCVSTALLARLSRMLGEGGGARLHAFHRRAQWLMVWFGLALGVATAVPAVLQVDAIGVDGVVRRDALHYLVVSNLGCLPMFVLMQTTAAMRAAGEALVPLLLLLGANLLNLALDLVLLFGWPEFGIPAIGPAGAAYASVSSRVVAALAGWWWLCRRNHPLSLRARAACGPVAVVAPLLRDAWPQAVQIGLRAAVVLVLTILVQSRFGDVATVSLGITTRLDTVVLFSSLGFANAATAFAGRAVVVGDVRRARLAGCWSAMQSMAFGAGFAVLFRENAGWVVGCFRPEATAELVDLVRLYFDVAVWAQVLGAGALGMIGAIYGAGSMVAPMVVDLIGFAGAGAILWAMAVGDAALATVYAALVLGMVVVLGCQSWHLVFGRWPLRHGLVDGPRGEQDG